MNINKDNELTQSNLLFLAVKVDFKRKDYANVVHNPNVYEEDLRKLYSGDTQVVDVNTSYGHHFKVWFELMLFLCLRGQANLRTMTKDTCLFK